MTFSSSPAPLATPDEDQLIVETLRKRGLLQDIIHEDELVKRFEEGPTTFYCGFDPTATSLTLGHLVPISAMRWLQRAGHRPIALLGSVTGMIGDPTSKTEERKLLDRETVRENCNGMRLQLERLLSLDEQSAPGLSAPKIIENGEWLDGVRMVDFLRDVGKHFTVNSMIAKDSVKSRFENREQGISYTEFSYMLIQALDFYHLFTNENCELQIGGSDQWGNITSGVELIRRRAGKTSYALTFPLLMTSEGKKMGKSEAGALWIDPNRTSPYQFFQYFLNTSDADAIRFLRFFTFLSDEEISSIETQSSREPEARHAQRRLAQEMTTWVHGQIETDRAIHAAQVLFSGDVKNIAAGLLVQIFADVPSSELQLEELANGIAVPELLLRIGASDSKGAARRSIEGGGIYLNGDRVSDIKQVITRQDFIDGQVLIARVGKKNYFLARISE